MGCVVTHLPTIGVDELCALYPESADSIRWFVNEPRLMPYEYLLCTVCGEAFEPDGNRQQVCTIECFHTLERNRYQGETGGHS